eukprot:GHVH01002025.1.p1 GENE.GHVH01002025.1~~GHVH01002025.1.p1  ORF type:complete len:612 (+),score=62.01 GHVH01002025.1:736-2571(+)
MEYDIEASVDDCSMVFTTAEIGSIRIHEVISLLSLCYAFYLLCYRDGCNLLHSPQYNNHDGENSSDLGNCNCTKRKAEKTELAEISNFLLMDVKKQVQRAANKFGYELAFPNIGYMNKKGQEIIDTKDQEECRYQTELEAIGLPEGSIGAAFLNYIVILVHIINLIFVLIRPSLDMATGVSTESPNESCDTLAGETDYSWLTAFRHAERSQAPRKQIDVWIWSNNSFNYLLLVILMHLSLEIRYSLLFKLSIFLMMIISAIQLNTLDTSERSFSWFAIQITQVLLICSKYYQEFMERAMWYLHARFRAVEQERRVLLQDMLPKSILIHFEQDCLQMSYKHDNMTFLFSDIVGFTAWSRAKPAMDVIMMLQSLFVSFDAYIVHYNVFKICTIGDAYVATSQPNCRLTSDVDEVRPPTNDDIIGMLCIIQLAKSMRARVAIVGRKLETESGQPAISMRIGIHHGCCVGGVIGSRRIRYDIWGRDVLIGNLMEQKASTGKVLVSEGFRKFYLKHQHGIACRLFPRLIFDRPITVKFEAGDTWLSTYHIDLGPDWELPKAYQKKTEDATSGKNEEVSILPSETDFPSHLRPLKPPVMKRTRSTSLTDDFMNRKNE